MSKFITKRNGTSVEFDLKKIHTAVKKACNSIGINFKDVLPLFDEALFEECDNIECIQDTIISTLRINNLIDLANAFSNYRIQHKKVREINNITKAFKKFANSTEPEVLKEAFTRLIGNGIVNDNANLDEATYGGRVESFKNVCTKYIALNYCMSERSAYNHNNNRIYIHDLSSYVVGSHNCLTIPFSKLLRDGFKTRNTTVRGAKSVGSALQLIAVIMQCQSQCQFGGVAAGTLDWDMVPYVRYSFVKYYTKAVKRANGITISIPNPINISIEDDAVYDKTSNAYTWAMEDLKYEIHQASESLYHNLNTLMSRGGDWLVSLISNN